MRHLPWQHAIVLALGMVLGAAMVLGMSATYASQAARPPRSQVNVASPLAAAPWVNSTVPQVVKARSFEVVDGAGKVRVRIGMSGIELFDARSRPLSFQGEPGGARIWYIK